MRHDWIFDVLSDLRLYAVKNGLHDLAAKVEETLLTAQTEVRLKARPGADDEGGGGLPP